VTNIFSVRRDPDGGTRRSVQRFRIATRTAIGFAICVPFICPFYFLVVTAFKSNNDYLHNQIGFPHHWVWAQFVSAWQTAGLGRALVNSAIAAGVGAIVLVVLAAPAADWCARTRSKRKAVFLGFVACVWMFPTIIWIIPLFVLLSHTGLTNSLLVLGVVYGVSNSPLCVFFLYSHLADAVDKEIREAAAVDGARNLQVFLRISLPMSLPILATVAILAVVWAWGDVLIAVILLQSNSNWTVTIASTNFASHFYGALQQEAAAAIISMLPLIVIFAVGQKAIVKGLTVGSGK
jgi:ABC-type glycerol-3-phosphate transport system permease component